MSLGAQLGIIELSPDGRQGEHRADPASVYFAAQHSLPQRCKTGVIRIHHPTRDGKFADELDCVPVTGFQP